MKFCPQCGLQVSHAAANCPDDRQPLISFDPGPAAMATGSGRKAFNANLLSPVKVAGAYRIYLQGSELFFIRTDGTSAHRWLGALLPHLGPIGALLGVLAWALTRRQSRQLRARLDAAEPEELLRQSHAHFRTHLVEVREAVLEAPSFLTISGSPSRITLHLRSAEKLRIGFDSVEEMKTALFVLVPVLRPVLRVQAQWDETKRRFRAPKAADSKFPQFPGAPR